MKYEESCDAYSITMGRMVLDALRANIYNEKASPEYGANMLVNVALTECTQLDKYVHTAIN